MKNYLKLCDDQKSDKDLDMLQKFLLSDFKVTTVDQLWNNRGLLESMPFLRNISCFNMYRCGFLNTSAAEKILQGEELFLLFSSSALEMMKLNCVWE